SQDFNEAIQNAANLADPALKAGEVVTNAMGLPVPRSGNFADVYQFKGGDGKMWAVKLFTRKVPGLRERYVKIDEHLRKAELPSGEVGHPNFQHPLRLKERLYNGDVDRFPHLVIAAALRATLIGGKALWDKFDNGDNLLFKEVDLREPGNAPVFKALWNLN